MPLKDLYMYVKRKKGVAPMVTQQHQHTLSHTLVAHSPTVHIDRLSMTSSMITCACLCNFARTKRWPTRPLLPFQAVLLLSRIRWRTCMEMRPFQTPRGFVTCKGCSARARRCIAPLSLMGQGARELHPVSGSGCP